MGCRMSATRVLLTMGTKPSCGSSGLHRSIENAERRFVTQDCINVHVSYRYVAILEAVVPCLGHGPRFFEKSKMVQACKACA